MRLIMCQLNQISLLNVHSFADLYKIAKNSRASLSFWGTRRIEVLNEKGQVTGRLPIDSLAASVMSLINQNPQLFAKEHAIGKLVSKEIDRIYNSVDALVKKRCFLIRWIIAIRDLSDIHIMGSGIFCVSKIRFLWKGRPNDDHNNSDKKLNEMFNYPELRYIPKGGCLMPELSKSVVRIAPNGWAIENFDELKKAREELISRHRRSYPLDPENPKVSVEGAINHSQRDDGYLKATSVLDGAFVAEYVEK